MRRSKRDLRPQRLLPQKHRSNNSSASLNSHHGGEIGDLSTKEEARRAPWGLVCPLVSFTMKF